MSSENSGLRGFQPRFYEGSASRHFLPLAYDLVGAIQPQLIVAAGFGDGQAYFTLCQAVRDHGLKCRCVAILSDGVDAASDDAWQRGLADVREWYGDFAELREGSPREVAAGFEDATIDLLLIDDCDIYDSAKAQFTAWRPKLRPGGFVLLHGIDLERAQPVSRLWSEIAVGAPAFELHTGAGLGVTTVGPRATTDSPLLKNLFAGPAEQRTLATEYAGAVEQIDARARVSEAERKSAALEMRQVWLQFLLDDRWNAQDVMDNQARQITELQARFDHLLRDREEAQRIMDAQGAELQVLREQREGQTAALEALRVDRGKAQEIMEAQAADLEALRRDRAKAQLVMDSQAEQLQHFAALRRDRAKAQLVMDSQAEQLKQWVMTTEQLREELKQIRAELKERKELIRFAKEACRRNGKCFQVPSGPRQQRSVSEKILREVQRIPRQLGLLSPPPSSRPPAKPLKATAPKPPQPFDRYAAWIAEHEPGATGLEEQRRAAESSAHAIRLSVVVPVFDTPPQFIDELIASLVAQTYGNWELCIADGGSSNDLTLGALRRWEVDEPRMRVVHLPDNQGISENTNRAIELASGDFVLLADHDDLLPPFAFHEMARAIAANPAADIFYSDEDRLSPDGKRHTPFFKPDWSPELLCSFMYTGHLTAYRRELVQELGGFRKEFDLSQDYDFALRATERAREIVHVPHVCYHWREHAASANMGGKPDARKSNLAALADAMRRRGLPADVLEYPTANRARLKVARWPRVSVVVPTDSPTRAQICLTSLPASTDYPDLEIVLVTNSRLAATLDVLEPGRATVRLVRYDKPFNFSDKCNAGAAAATGERVIFFNDDVEATHPDWIQNVIEQLENPAVGAVAPKLLYETGKIQHAGLVMGVRGLAGTAFHQWPADSTDYFNMPQALRDVSVLSGACLAMRRDDFLRLGGFDAVNTPIAHSDIDLCFKIREAGMRCVYTPFATLQHAGHVSIAVEEKERVVRARDKASIFLLKRWAGYTTYDPYFPDHMREWLYADSPTPIAMFGRNQGAPPQTVADVLFVSHDLSLSGAPMMLLHAASWCQRHGYFATVMSPTDGPLREKLQAADIPVIVDPLILTGHESFAQFAREFDCVVANTILSGSVVLTMQGHGVPVTWWLHEPASVGEHFIGEERALRAALPLADRIFAPSERTAAVYRAFTDNPVQCLRNAIPDVVAESMPARLRSDGRLRFLLVASVEPRKGQDVFVQALAMLPRDVQKAAEFEIAGRVLDPEFGAKVRAISSHLENLVTTGARTHAESIELIRSADVLISASRDEAMPTVTILEAMSLGKAIIATSVGGAVESLSDGENALLVKAEDPAQMSAAIRRLIENPTLARSLGANARATYEKDFTMERFGPEFVAILRDAMAGTSDSPRPAAMTR